MSGPIEERIMSVPDRIKKEPLGAAASINEWLSDSFGALDAMLTLQKLAALLKAGAIAERLDTYCAGFSVPYFPQTIIAFNKALETGCKEGWTAHRRCTLLYNFFDAGATGAYAASFFTNNFKIGRMGVYLNTVADACETGVFATDYLQVKQWKNRLAASGGSDELQEALSSRITYDALKILKTASAAVSGFFVSHAMLTGICLIAPFAAIAISLFATLCNIAAFHQKTLSCYDWTVVKTA